MKCFRLKSKSSLIIFVGFIIFISFFILLFFSWKKGISFLELQKLKKKGNQQYFEKNEPIINLEHRIIFLPESHLRKFGYVPGVDLSFKGLRFWDINNWPVFIAKKYNFSIKYPPESKFKAEKQKESISQCYHFSHPKNLKGLQFLGQYCFKIDKSYTEQFGGPYHFFFNIGIYKITTKFPLETYLIPFLSQRESKAMSPEEFQEWQFLICQPIWFKNIKGKVCNRSYNSPGDFYLFSQNTLYVINGFGIEESPSPSRENNDMCTAHQTELMFQTIVSTFQTINSF
jgi:hypothetical protein